MPKICVQSPEVFMQGDISIHAQVGIVTKAKLESISVNGNCDCGEKVVVQKPLVELVILVDGSDSYNGKVGADGNSSFEKTIDVVGKLIEGVSDTDRAVISVIQFSGIKQVEKKYVPGSGGAVDGVKMWEKLAGPSKLGGGARSIIREIKGAEPLDGNGQLFLCLQDLCMDNYLRDLDRAQSLAKNQDRNRVIIVFTDEEWDIKNLKNGFGSGTTDKNTVVAQVHKQYGAVFPCILRRDHDTAMNEDFIHKKLANGHSDRVNVIHTDNWKATTSAAIKNILGQLRL